MNLMTARDFMNALNRELVQREDKQGKFLDKEEVLGKELKALKSSLMLYIHLFGLRFNKNGIRKQITYFSKSRDRRFKAEICSLHRS